MTSTEEEIRILEESGGVPQKAFVEIEDTGREQYNYDQESYVGSHHRSFKEMFDNEVNSGDILLEDNEKYFGSIYGIYYSEGLGYKITIEVEVSIKGKKGIISTDFLFGGDYDEFNMKRLVRFLSTVENSKELLKTVRASTIEQIAKSIKKIEGASVSVVSKTSSKGNKYYILELLGTYNKEKQCIEG